MTDNAQQLEQFCRRSVAGSKELDRLAAKSADLAKTQKSKSEAVMKLLGEVESDAVAVDIGGQTHFVKPYVSKTYRMCQAELFVDVYLLTMGTSERKPRKRRVESDTTVSLDEHAAQIVQVLKGDLVTHTPRFRIDAAPPRSGKVHQASPEMVQLTSDYLAATSAKKTIAQQRSELSKRTTEFARRSAEGINGTLGIRTHTFVVNGESYALAPPRPTRKPSESKPPKASVSIPALTKTCKTKGGAGQENALLMGIMTKIGMLHSKLQRSYTGEVPPSALRQAVASAFEEAVRNHKAAAIKSAPPPGPSPPRLTPIKRPRAS